MGNRALMSRAIRYQKTASDSIFTIVTTLQSSNEKMMRETLNQYSWLPESSKKGLFFWYDTCNQTTTGLKKMVDRSYEEAQKYFEAPSPEAPSTKPAAKKPATTKAAPQKKAATKTIAKVSPTKKPAASTKSTPAKTATTKKKTTQAPQAKKSSTTVKTAAAEKQTSSTPKEDASKKTGSSATPPGK